MFVRAILILGALVVLFATAILYLAWDIVVGAISDLLAQVLWPHLAMILAAWGALALTTILAIACIWIAFEIGRRYGPLERVPLFFGNMDRVREFNREHDALREDRRRFWEILKCYNWGLDDWNDLERLVDMLPCPTFESVGPDADKWSQQATPEEQEALSTALFALSVDSREEGDRRNELLRLHGRLSSYWHRVGEEALRDRLMPLGPIVRTHFPHQSRLLKLLMYFEFANECNLGGKQFRKPYLFKLGGCLDDANML